MMAIERCYSLRKAARILGVHHQTLGKWLLADVGLATPAVPRGSKLMIRESDLERLIAKRGLLCCRAKAPDAHDFRAKRVA
jgi:predicted site-specific integrase-resolvase